MRERHPDDYARIGLQIVPLYVMRAEGVPDTWPAPAYHTEGAAGFDLPAWLPGGSVRLAPGRRMMIDTGWHVEVPPGYEAQVRPRSGLATAEGIIVLNSPGTVDSDFRGHMRVCMFNTNPAGCEPYEIKHGARIAQVIISPVVRAAINVTDKLRPTARGEGGWGSTGA